MIDEAILCRVLDILEANGGVIVTTNTLMEQTDLSRRVLQKYIRELRLRGHLIASTTNPPGGYSMILSPEGAAAFAESMARRGRAVFAAAHAARKYAKETEQGEHDR